MPLLFSRKLKEQSNSEFKGEDKDDLSIEILLLVGLRMGEQKDEDSTLRALSSSDKIWPWQ